MTKIDIFSGFLGAGKTTLIKKLLSEVFNNEKVVLIENEFGEIGIDGGFLKDAGIEITEMNSGCICCSLVGDFGTALKEVIDKFNPSRILIEPSGVGKLSDVIKAVIDVKENTDIELNSSVTVVDVQKCKMYMKNFGEFFNNQIESAKTIILSRTQNVSEQKLQECLNMIKDHNKEATIITTPWEQLKGSNILSAMEKNGTIAEQLLKEEDICPKCGHHHHEGECCHHGEEGHYHEGECCHHGEEGHHHEGECCHHGEEGHHHEGECCHHGEEGHHHEGECCHHEGHDHHHHADDVFSSWGIETPHKFKEDEIKNALEKLSTSDEFGTILRAKGIVPDVNGDWIYFDLVPGEYDIRKGEPDYTGKLCVIGAKLKEDEISKLFSIE